VTDGKTVAEGDAQKARFFTAAEPLLERFGFRKTTVEEVCREAGASKRTFYELFEDKQDLCVQLILHVWNRETEMWEESLSADAEPEERLESFIHFYTDTVRRHPFFEVLVEDMDIMRSLGGAVEEFRVSRVGGPVEQILRDGMANGRFRDLEPQVSLWVVFGLLDTFYMIVPRVMEAPGPLEDPVLAEEIKEFIVRGLRGSGSEE
jgi:AcrR family transcriptional regulator